MNRRTSIMVLLAAFMCACLYQEAVARKQIKDMFKKESQPEVKSVSDKWTPFEPYTPKEKPVQEQNSSEPGDKARAASKEFLWNPLKFVLRLIAIITYPPRFIIRFFFTFAAVFFLVLFNCQVIPEVRCIAPVRDMIPGIMDGLKEELDFYVSLGNDDE